MLGLEVPAERRELARTTPMRIEPKTFFANERTFLAWLHMAVTLGSISAALLGFAAGVWHRHACAQDAFTELHFYVVCCLHVLVQSFVLSLNGATTRFQFGSLSSQPLDQLTNQPTLAGSTSDAPDGEAISRHLVELIALILLPLAMGMSCYALYVFIWRARNIEKKRATHFDDRYGPLAVCGAVVVALIAIFMITCIDFVEVMKEEEAASGGSPPPSLAGVLAVETDGRSVTAGARLLRALHSLRGAASLGGRQ